MSVPEALVKAQISSTERELSRKKVVRNPVTTGVRFIVRWMFFVVLNIVGPIFGRFLRPDFLFCVYGTDNDRAHYWPTRLQWMLPTVVTIGVMKQKGAWGLVLGYPRGYRALLNDEAELKKFLDRTRSLYPKAGKVALAGSLPKELNAKGITLVDPFVNGVYGTVFTMTRAAVKLAEMVGKPEREIRFAILGGGGFIGERVAEDLSQRFGKVIAFDPKFSSCGIRGDKGKYLRTFDKRELENVDAAIVLTARGDNIRSYASVFGPGVVMGDDTHPCMTPGLVAQLRNQGVRLFKVCNRHGLIMVPRLPNFRHDHVPGCLLEAIVTGEVGGLASQEEFNAAAIRQGVEISLDLHPDA